MLAGDCRRLSVGATVRLEAEYGTGLRKHWDERTDRTGSPARFRLPEPSWADRRQVPWFLRDVWIRILLRPRLPETVY